MKSVDFMLNGFNYYYYEKKDDSNGFNKNQRLIKIY